MDIRDRTVLCGNCQRPIIMAEDLQGKEVLLDPKPEVYRYQEIGGRVRVQRLHNVAVSHLAVCPKANELSGSKKG